MELIDSHCHLDAVERSALPQLIANAVEFNVTRMICVGASNGLASAAEAQEISRQFANVWFSVGVHPHDAGKHTTLDELGAFAADPKAVAVGETGLDYFRDMAPKEDQHTLFRNTIAFAKNVRKPLIIHCREAAEDTLSILIECKASEVGGVFHCYAEDAEFAKRLRDIGFLVSVTGNVTFKKADAIRKTFTAVPLDQIMLETDMPYLAPEPFRGKPSEPKHVLTTAMKIAEIKGVSLEEVARVTTATALKFFKLP